MVNLHIPALLVAAFALACTPATVVGEDGGSVDDVDSMDDAGSTENEINDDGGNAVLSLIVSPLVCDFDALSLIGLEFCEITLKNPGDSDIRVDTVRFADETLVAMNASGWFDPLLPGFGLQTIVFLPLFIAPKTAVTLTLFARSAGPGELRGGLLIGGNDFSLTVSLKITGNSNPIAVASVKSVNDSVVEDDLVIGPGDDVVLTLEDSFAIELGATIASHEWWIISKPDESSVELSNPTGSTTGFISNLQGIDVVGFDVVGTYEIGGRVKDSDGVVSVNDAVVVLPVTFPEALHVELTWDSPTYNFDLHLIKDVGPWCSPNSCWYANCNTDNPFEQFPNWDGVLGFSLGDPYLDIDDIYGYGPENIRIDVPVDASYRIGVHAYSPTLTNEVSANVKVFVNGLLVFEDSREMTSGNSFWEVVDVIWSNGTSTISPVDQFVESDWSCTP